MSGSSFDLWPEEVHVKDVLTPFAILLMQKNQLEKHTDGLVKGDIMQVSSVAPGESAESIEYSFSLKATTFEYKYELFRIKHDRSRVYPCKVYHWVFGDPEYGEEWIMASNMQEFLNAVAKILKTVDTVSVIQSIVARSRELNSTASE